MAKAVKTSKMRMRPAALRALARARVTRAARVAMAAPRPRTQIPIDVAARTTPRLQASRPEVSGEDAAKIIDRLHLAVRDGDIEHVPASPRVVPNMGG